MKDDGRGKEGGWVLMEDLRVGEFNGVNLRRGWDQQVIKESFRLEMICEIIESN